MRKTEYNRKQVVKYLLWTFVTAYAVQIAVGVLYRNGNAQIGQLIMTAMMFLPALGVLVCGAGLKALGWSPQIRKNIRPLLIAWLSPAVLTAAGAALYFLLFRSHLDLGGKYLEAAGGAQVLAQLEAQGISYSTYILITCIQCLTYAPLINAIPALGEEIGWRGFLYPQLKAKYGRTKGWILGGVIWGAWHWPLIWLIGYEYGSDYIGFPVMGMLLFCVFTIALGILSDWLYDRSGSIWLPSIFHGAINAAATVPLAICIPGTGSARLLGPVPNGIIAGLPLLIFAVVLLMRESDQTAKQ